MRRTSSSILGLLLAAALAACSEQQPSLNAQQATGKSLYLEHCASCHGPEGEGAPNWQERLPNGTFPPPPHDSSGHTWHHPDDLLLQIIAEGGQMPGSGMPAFKEKLDQGEMEAILAYIKTLWTPEHREVQADLTLRAREENP